MSYINGVRSFENIDKFGDKEVKRIYKNKIKETKDYFGAEFAHGAKPQNSSLGMSLETNNFYARIGGKKIRLF